MPRCKICGEDVRAGTVLHIECYKAWREEMNEREQELDMREFELDVRDGFMEQWYAEVLETEKKAKRLLAIDIAVAAFNVVVALMVIFIR